MSNLFRGEVFAQLPELLQCNVKPVFAGNYVATNLLGDRAVPIPVHALEHFFQRGLLAHELPECKATIVVSVHPLEELGNLRPGKLTISNKEDLSITISLFFW